jgi:endo-1,4-beta-xylanase
MVKSKKKWILVTLFTLLLSFSVGLTVFFLSQEETELDTRSEAKVSEDNLPKDLEFADLNFDKAINLEDFGIWLKDFRAFKENTSAYKETSDFDDNQNIDLYDFGIWLRAFRKYKSILAGGIDCSLADFAKEREFNVGAYLNVCFSSRQLNLPKCKEVVKKEYSGMMVQVQDLWKWSEYNQGEIESEGLDELLNFARENNLKVHFFHLIWSDRYSPVWLFPGEPDGSRECGDWTREELLEIMEKRIRSYIEYTEDIAVAWNVVNEAFRENGRLSNYCWRKIIGDDYIDRAFMYAEEVLGDRGLEDRMLVFNDNFGVGRMSRVEIDAVFDYIKKAKEERGIRIDAFGLQNHLYEEVGEQFTTGYLQDLEYFFDKAEDAGVKVLITEMDVYQAGRTQERVAELYEEVVSRCLRRSNCVSFATWGVDDASSWLRSSQIGLPYAKPLLFDEELNRKPAYYSVLRAMGREREEKCIRE